MEVALLAIAVGLGVGVVVGALGAGGGILAVPVLVFLLGQSAPEAAASSLVIVLITALFSIPHHARQGNVQWRGGLVFAGVGVLGAVLGSRLSLLMPAQVLLTLFSVLLAVVGAAMAVRGLRARRGESTAAAAVHDDPVLDQPGPDTVGTADGTLQHHGELEVPRRSGPPPQRGPRLRLPVLLLTATLTGLLTGFFGVGGGFIVVPMLVLALGLRMRHASGTSLLVMIVATTASLLARIGAPIEIDWRVTLLFAVGSALGGMLGGPLSARARASTLTLIFAALLGGVAVVTLAGTLGT